MIDLKPFEVAARRQRQRQKEGGAGRLGGEEWRGGRDGGEEDVRGKGRDGGAGCQRGGEARRQGEGTKDEGEQGVDAWLEGLGRETGGGGGDGGCWCLSWHSIFLHTHTHTTTNGPRRCIEPSTHTHLRTETFTHSKPTLKHSLLYCCSSSHSIRGAEMWTYLHKWVLYSEPVDSGDG